MTDHRDYCQMLCDGELDLAIVLDAPIKRKPIQVLQKRKEIILIAAASTHDLTGAHRIQPEDLSVYPLLLPAKDCPYRILFEQRLSADGRLHPRHKRNGALWCRAWPAARICSKKRIDLPYDGKNKLQHRFSYIHTAFDTSRQISFKRASTVFRCRRQASCPNLICLPQTLGVMVFQNTARTLAPADTITIHQHQMPSFVPV